jgi:copper oxidase (laccase) domain-containing protein
MPSSLSAASTRDDPPPTLLPAESLNGRLPGLRAGFSAALPRADDAVLAPVLRALAAGAWGAAPEALPLPLLLRQTHSARVLGLADGPAPDAPPGCDGAVASRTDALLLAIKAADCVPLLAVDAERGRYAALHAGWRGTAAGILPALLEAWRGEDGGLRGVHLELGAHIRDCCYEVRADCLAHFAPRALDGAVRVREGRTFLGLAALLRAQALAAGVPPAQIVASAPCTCCHRDADGRWPYASYRRAMQSGAPYASTNVALIGIVP